MDDPVTWWWHPWVLPYHLDNCRMSRKMRPWIHRPVSAARKWLYHSVLQLPTYELSTNDTKAYLANYTTSENNSSGFTYAFWACRNPHSTEFILSWWCTPFGEWRSSRTARGGTMDQYDTALWLARRQSIILLGLTLCRDTCWPTIPFGTCPQWALRLLGCCRIYAPQSGIALSDRTTWWTQLAALLKTEIGKQDLVPMIYANAATGAADGKHVFEHDDTTTIGTSLVRELLTVQRLRLPATSRCHQGHQATWICPATDTDHRIDVAVPLSWSTSCTLSRIIPEFDLGNIGDHTAVGNWSTMVPILTCVSQEGQQNSEIPPPDHQCAASPTASPTICPLGLECGHWKPSHTLQRAPTSSSAAA